MNTSIQKREWLFVAVVTLILLALTTLPYLFAWLTAPADKEFTGFIINTSDHAQYLSWYKGFQTENLIDNKQTSEENPKIFFNLLWWVLARFGRLTGLHHSVVYQIFRWLAGALFLFALYGFATLFYTTIFQRRLAFLVVALGSGMGWVLVVLKYILHQPDVMFPLDVYVSEGNSLLCILGYPHFAEAAGLILAILGLLLVGETRRQWRYPVTAGLVALFLGWQHAYDLFIVWIVPMAYGAVLFIKSRRWPSYWFWGMLIVGLISWPPALYSVLLTRLNPIWEEVLAQFSNAGVYTPNIFHMLILMGIPLWMAIATWLWWAWSGVKRKDTIGIEGRNLFLMVWFVVGWALTYIPTDFQIHMISSWQVVVGLLAVSGFCLYALPWLEQHWPLARKAIVPAMALIIVVTLTNVYLFAWRFIDLKRYTYPYYLYHDEVAAMHWLETNVPEETVILSSYDVGRYIPGISGRVGFLSHWAQTVDFLNKRELVTGWYDSQGTPKERQEFLDHYQIDYIFYGPAERALGTYDPQGENSLQEAYHSPLVNIYAVVKK